MQTKGYTLRAQSWADSAYASARCFVPPIDLLAVARQRRVKRIGLRLMIPRGALVPVEGGFEIFLRDLESRDLDLDGPETQSVLSAQQRFTLAHEIAHTYFYKSVGEMPIPTGEVKRYVFGSKEDQLEETCNRVAKRLLVPTQLLKNEIGKELGHDCERIDASFVRTMVNKFRVSYEVMIERLRAAEPENAFTRCILLVRTAEGKAQVKTWYMGVTLLSVLPRLEKYQPLERWFPDLSRTIGECHADSEYQVLVNGHTFTVRNLTLGRPGDCLLQLDDLARTVPASA